MEVRMEERKVIEKRTEVRREEQEKKKPGVTNINVGPDGSTQVQQEDVVDDPVGTTTVREETRIEEKKSR
jgi:hypothetical protein